MRVTKLSLIVSAALIGSIAFNGCSGSDGNSLEEVEKLTGIDYTGTYDKESIIDSYIYGSNQDVDLIKTDSAFVLNSNLGLAQGTTATFLNEEDINLDDDKYDDKVVNSIGGLVIDAQLDNTEVEGIESEEEITQGDIAEEPSIGNVDSSIGDSFYTGEESSPFLILRKTPSSVALTSNDNKIKLVIGSSENLGFSPTISVTPYKDLLNIRGYNQLKEAEYQVIHGADINVKGVDKKKVSLAELDKAEKTISGVILDGNKDLLKDNVTYYYIYYNGSEWINAGEVGIDVNTGVQKNFKLLPYVVVAKEIKNNDETTTPLMNSGTYTINGLSAISNPVIVAKGSYIGTTSTLSKILRANSTTTTQTEFTLDATSDPDSESFNLIIPKDFQVDNLVITGSNVADLNSGISSLKIPVTNNSATIDKFSTIKDTSLINGLDSSLTSYINSSGVDELLSSISIPTNDSEESVKASEILDENLSRVYNANVTSAEDEDTIPFSFYDNGMSTLNWSNDNTNYSVIINKSASTIEITTKQTNSETGKVTYSKVVKYSFLSNSIKISLSETTDNSNSYTESSYSSSNSDSKNIDSSIVINEFESDHKAKLSFNYILNHKSNSSYTYTNDDGTKSSNSSNSSTVESLVGTNLGIIYSQGIDTFSIPSYRVKQTYSSSYSSTHDNKTTSDSKVLNGTISRAIQDTTGYSYKFYGNFIATPNSNYTLDIQPSEETSIYPYPKQQGYINATSSSGSYWDTTYTQASAPTLNKTINCSNSIVSGNELYKTTYSVDMKESEGKFDFTYNPFGTISDQFTFKDSSGKVIFDSGCVTNSEAKTESIYYSGGSDLTLEVSPACGTNGTYGNAWEFKVECPVEAAGEEPNTGSDTSFSSTEVSNSTPTSPIVKNDVTVYLAAGTLPSDFSINFDNMDSTDNDSGAANSFYITVNGASISVTPNGKYDTKEFSITANDETKVHTYDKSATGVVAF